MRGIATCAALVAVAACPAAPPGNRGPVNLTIQLATRQSCGVISGLEYDTSCIVAVDVRAIDPVTRLPITEQCSAVQKPVPGTLGGLLEGDALVSVANLSANRSVIFQVRGLHGTGDDATALCADANTSDGQWLFWGDSDPVDLSKYDGDAGPSPIIRIVLDCRDCTFGEAGCETAQSCSFGCGGFGDQCSPVLPTSFCIPTVECNKHCDSNDDCFEGARGCVNHTCDTTTPTGTLCSPCGGTGGAGCADGFLCVKTAGVVDGFCADLCPGADHVCASGTKCTRLGNGVVLAP